MAGRRRVGVWLLRALAVLIIGGLAVYLYAVGLDKADKVASALSLVVAVVVLVAPLFRRRQVEPAEEKTAAAEPGTTELAGSEPAGVLPARGVAYLEDVRQLAPRALLDREPELAALAAFCADGESTYWRWVADAWSGKSALLAWFVLHPSRNVDAVSFFITSRFNPHNNRDAFIEAVTEQLDALLGVRSSYAARGQVRTRHLQARLAEAAELSRRAGRRLVLVVDGLDEDRGVVVDSETYTIASLLPPDPVPGLKVIVAGRSHPPLPPEVGGDHPLRSAANIHTLTASRHAKANQATASLELRRLLNDPVARKVLGLLTAAGGGLTVADLATLAERTRHEIGQLIQSSIGRTFISRPGRWTSDTQTFGLAHEELRKETLRSLDPAELVGHRESLKRWADEVAANGWPADTPEYLLRGYPGLLLDLGDLDRAVALTADQARMDRLLSITGGDYGARIELAGIVNAVLATDRPNLGFLARLALHREHLEERSSRLPTDLPALWVRLGEDEKANELAHGISADSERRRAVDRVTQALRDIGDVRRLERLVQTSDDPDQVLRVLIAFLEEAQRAGDDERIDVLTARILTVLPAATNEEQVRDAMTRLANVGDGLAEQAQQLIGDPYLGVFALLGRVWKAHIAGDRALAGQLAERAQSMIGGLTGQHRRRAEQELSISPAAPGQGPEQPTAEAPVELPDTLMYGAERLYRNGDQAAADAIVDTATRLLESLTPEDHFWSRLRDVVETLGRLGDTARALSLIDAGRSRFGRDGDYGAVQRATEALVQGLISGGCLDAAGSVLAQVTDRSTRNRLVTGLARRAARQGDLPRARALVVGLADDFVRLEALAEVAAAVQAAGDDDEALRIVDEGAAIADRLAAGPEVDVVDEERLYREVVRLAAVAVAAGRPDRGAELATWVQDGAARGVEHPTYGGLQRLVEILARSGDLARAAAVVLVISPENRREPIQWQLVSMLLVAGEDERAEAVARRVQYPLSRIELLVRVIRHRADGEALAAELCGPLTAADGSGIPPAEAAARRSALVALAAAGSHEAAERLVAGLADPEWRQRMLAAVRGAAARGGHDDAERLVARLTDPADRALALVDRMTAAAEKGRPEQVTEFVGQAIAESEAVVPDSARLPIWERIVAAAVVAGLEERVTELLAPLEAGVESLPDDDAADRGWRTLGDAYRKLSQPEQALAAFHRIVRNSDRRWAITSWAEDAVLAGDLPLVERLIASIDDVDQNLAWRSVAEAAAESGDYLLADRLADRGGSLVRRSLSAAVVRAAGEAGNFAFAEEKIVRLEEQRELPDATSAELLCALAETVGDPADARVKRWLEQAEKAAMGARYPEDRGTALSRIAEVAEPERARRLLARAMLDAPWYESLPQLARLDPEGLARLADVIVESVERRGRSGTLDGDE
ncbi:hypothetical protein ACIBL3_00630 [Kribbella sp. NPDC050124]|uniref:hypothetical protein n=1 Tax=Kribbella sp. NPDC050124 TaxID=3364114 RepID=UPI003797B60B